MRIAPLSLILWFGFGLVYGDEPTRIDSLPGDEWVYLDNHHIRLGVKKSSGGCIGFLSASGSPRNLLNHYDQGRLVQQSYYGKTDGTMWADKPWRWNPVQGGDYKGTPSKLLELEAKPTQLYSKTQPRHWSGCVDLPEVTMEQWITLDGKLAHVRFKMTYTGKTAHPTASQEIPAFFAESDLDTLVLYDGNAPWTGEQVHRSKPSWPNESRKITEHWAAYVDKEDFGVGVFVPIANEITCYRFGKAGEKDACSYCAPLTRFAITPDFVFNYDFYLTIGKSDEIRVAFRALHENNKIDKSK